MRVRAQIRETQENRRKQAERDKALREGRSVEEPVPVAAKPAAPKTTTSHTETRLQLRLPDGQPPLIKSFPVEATLSEVAEAIKAERGE